MLAQADWSVARWTDWFMEKGRRLEAPLPPPPPVPLPPPHPTPQAIVDDISCVILHTAGLPPPERAEGVPRPLARAASCNDEANELYMQVCGGWGWGWAGAPGTGAGRGWRRVSRAGADASLARAWWEASRCRAELGCSPCGRTLRWRQLASCPLRLALRRLLGSGVSCLGRWKPPGKLSRHRKAIY